MKHFFLILYVKFKCLSSSGTVRWPDSTWSWRHSISCWWRTSFNWLERQQTAALKIWRLSQIHNIDSLKNIQHQRTKENHIQLFSQKVWTSKMQLKRDCVSPLPQYHKWCVFLILYNQVDSSALASILLIPDACLSCPYLLFALLAPPFSH